MFDFGADSLVSPSNFEALTGIVSDSLSASEKLKVELTVKGINAQIKRFCSSSISLGNYVEVWDSQGSDLLIPTETPITSITSIKVASDGNFDGVESLAGSDFVIHPSKQFISLRYYRFPKGRGMVEVKYSAGYSTVPLDIQMAVCNHFLFLSQSSPTHGLKTISKMNETQTIDDRVAEFGFPASVYSVLKLYQRIEAPLSVMFARVS